MTRIGGIIFARMNSSRLPGKAMIEINGITLIERVIERAKQISKIDHLCVATSIHEEDDIIASFSESKNVDVYRGDKNNVLKRYFDCAKIFRVRNIIRVTSDCPLIDPYLVKKMYKNFQRNKTEYLANTLPEKNKKYPDGSDIEIFTFAALKKMYKLRLNKHDREHVTNKFWDSGKFKKKIFFSKLDFSKYRYSIDYQSDVTVVRFIIAKLIKLNQFGFVKEIVNIIEKNKNIKKIMSQNMIQQKLRRKNIF